MKTCGEYSIDDLTGKEKDEILHDLMKLAIEHNSGVSMCPENAVGGLRDAFKAYTDRLTRKGA